MVSEINGPVSSLIQGPGPTENRAQQGGNQQTPPAPAAQTGGDRVVLTDTASKLRASEQSIAATPVVDTQRVAQVRQTIEDGSYEVSPERIADKFMQFEARMPESNYQ
jgi:negative regulator of flagellin synthesis FlgM